jgi:ankyrin repeat protein
MNKFDSTEFSKYINTRDKTGRTPLSWASERDDEDMMRSLLQHGANIEIPDHNHWTPLRYASIAPTTRAMRVLLEQEASVAPECHYQTNAMHDVAYHKRNLEYVKLLEEAGCLLDHQDTGLRTPLAKACHADNDVVAEYLLHQGANANNVDDAGMSCVASAVRNGANRVLKLLLSSGGEYHHIDIHGSSILHWAAASETVNEETLDTLIAARLRGVEVGLRDKSRHTAAQVLSVRPDVDGAFRAKFRELLESIVPPEPRKSGPDHPDAWFVPVTVM